MSAIPFIVLLATCTGCLGECVPAPRERTHSIQRDPVLQERIDRVMTGAPGNSAFFTDVQRLKEMTRGRDGVRALVRQAILYSIQRPPVAEDDAGIPSNPLPTLSRWMGIDSTVVVLAALPLLEGNDEAVKTFVIDRMLGGVDRPLEDRSGLPEEYEFYLRGLPAPPTAFVEVIYRKDPSAAVRAITQVYANDLPERRKILWANHVIDDVIWKRRHGFLVKGESAAATEQLDALSKSKQWWVRAYAAETLWRYDWLRGAEVVARLRADDHSVVRRLLARPQQSDG